MMIPIILSHSKNKQTSIQTNKKNSKKQASKQIFCAFTLTDNSYAKHFMQERGNYQEAKLFPKDWESFI